MKKTKQNNKNVKKLLILCVSLFIALVGGYFIVQSKAETIPQLTPDTRFWWQLQGTINPNSLDGETGNKVYDVDVHDTSISTINALRSKNIKVICYFSVGTAEDWREDFDQFIYPGDRSNNLLPDWDGEYFINTESNHAREVMAKRMDLAVSKNCDGVEIDNLDTYTYNSGLPLTKATALDYMMFLANAAHQRGLAIGLKNVPDLVYNSVGGQPLHKYFDFALNEQCYQYNECNNYEAFINDNKAVFIVEYTNNDTRFVDVTCPKALNNNFDAYNMNLALNGNKRIACRTSGEVTNPEPPTAKTGDINNDGQVDIVDLSMLLSAWGTNNNGADLDSSGSVDIVDLSILLSGWSS